MIPFSIFSEKKEESIYKHIERGNWRKKHRGGSRRELLPNLSINFKIYYLSIKKKQTAKNYRSGETYAQNYTNVWTLNFFWQFLLSISLWIWNANLGVKLTDTTRVATHGAAGSCWFSVFDSCFWLFVLCFASNIKKTFF